MRNENVIKRNSLWGILLLLVFTFHLSPLTLQAQSTAYFDRPRVAVVLSGGGAKGVAHISALKAIEEAGCPST